MREEALRRELLRRLEVCGEVDDQSLKRMIAELVGQNAKAMHLTLLQREEMARHLFDSIRGLDVLDALLADDAVTEVMVNGKDAIFVEKGGRLTRLPQSFSSGEKLMDVIRQIVGRCNRVINERNPITDARLPDGSRVHAVIAPIALDGPILTIRRFPEERIRMTDLISYDALTEEAAAYLAELVQKRKSILIGGGTSAGKTTFLNALTDFIPAGERIITIEDNAELQLGGIENLVRLEAKQANMEGNVEITIRDLIRASLRMRPDRIIVGEVRGGEAVDMLQALNTGHDGSMSTIHANSCADMLGRLEVMVLLGAYEMPDTAVRRQIASGIDVLVHLKRDANGKRKLMEIARLKKAGTGEIETVPVFLREEGADILRRVNV